MYNKYTNGKKIINATDKAYNLIFKFNGYSPLENEAIEQPTKGDKEFTDILDIESYTKAEIIKILTEKGIQYNSRDTKQKLYGLLIGSD